MIKKILIYLIFLVPLLGCSPENLRQTADGYRFSIRAPQAKSVAIAGNFNNWNTSSHKLSPTKQKGVWSITIRLQPGRYEYLFLIDGEKWVTDPDVPSVDDGLGGRNSVINLE